MPGLVKHLTPWYALISSDQHSEVQFFGAESLIPPLVEAGGQPVAYPAEKAIYLFVTLIAYKTEMRFLFLPRVTLKLGFAILHFVLGS